MRTITQVAEELVISRKRVYSLIQRLNIKTTKDGRNNFIENNEFERIKNEVINSKDNNIKKRLKNVLERDVYVTGGGISDREYTDFKEQITFLQEKLKSKDEQLKMRDEQFIGQLQVKDEQIKSKDYQINGLIQSNFNFTKALNPPFEEVAVTKEVRENFFSRIFKKRR
jgi:flagellar capping protein FliD